MVYSIMAHPEKATKLLLAAEQDAQDNARWALIDLPTVHPKYGKPAELDKGMAEARAELKTAIDRLPKDAQPEVRKKFEDAMKAYEDALKKAK